MADRMADLEARVAALEMIITGKPEGVVGPPVPEQVHDVIDREGDVRPQSRDDKDVIVLDGSHDTERVTQEMERDEKARDEAERATHKDDEKPTAAWLEPEKPVARRRAAPKDDDKDDDEPKPAAARPAEEPRRPVVGPAPRPADQADLHSGGVARNPAIDAHNHAPDAHKPTDTPPAANRPRE